MWNEEGYSSPIPGKIIFNSDKKINILSTISMSTQQAVKNIGSPTGENIFWTSDVSVELPIIVSDGDMGSIPPCTIIDTFADAVRRFGTLPALNIYIEKDKWDVITWEEYWSLSCQFAKALLAIGIQPRDRVAIMGMNSKEWNISYFGTIISGSIAVGVYPNQSEEIIRYILSHSQASVIIVDSVEAANIAVRSKNLCPSLRCIVIFSTSKLSGQSHSEGMILFSDFIRLGHSVSDETLQLRMIAQRPGQCCTILYINSTESQFPKGVMLSHDNLIWQSRCIAYMYNLSIEDRSLSHLPHSHITGLMLDILVPLVSGCLVIYPRLNEENLFRNTDTLVKILCESKPTFFATVPRIWKKLEKYIYKDLKKYPKLITKIIHYSRAYTSFKLDNKKSFFNQFVKSFIHKKLHSKIGLQECKVAITLSAPIPISTSKFYDSISLPLCNVYGSTEASGMITANVPILNWYLNGSVGKIINGGEMYIANPDDLGRGEICYRGRGVFMGYLNDKTGSQRVIDSTGFFHTGDVGSLDNNGFLNLNWRLKAMVVTDSGESVSISYVEKNLEHKLYPLIRFCTVVGDGSHHIGVLFSLNENVLHSDLLNNEAIEFLKKK